MQSLHSDFDKEIPVVFFIRLDLLAAFHITDHAFTISRLHDMYRIHNQVLAYLSDRLQRVNMKRTLPDN